MNIAVDISNDKVTFRDTSFLLNPNKVSQFLENLDDSFESCKNE